MAPWTGARSLKNIAFGVTVGLAAPVAAWLTDPGLTSPVHRVILGAFVIIFVIGDSFSSGAIANYNAATYSRALTIKEMQRLQAKVTHIRRSLRTLWWSGMGLRAAHTIVLAMLIVSSLESRQATLALIGYALLGVSIVIVVSLGSSFALAERFIDDFRLAERRELERERLLYNGQ